LLEEVVGRVKAGVCGFGESRVEYLAVQAPGGAGRRGGGAKGQMWYCAWSGVGMMGFLKLVIYGLTRLELTVLFCLLRWCSRCTLKGLTNFEIRCGPLFCANFWFLWRKKCLSKRTSSPC
jgi:hypothetical protein